MIKTFVINLDTDIKRMAFMNRQLKALDLPYERYPAVQPGDVLPGEYDAARAHSQGGHMLIPGELGCALSHKRIYETVLERGLAFALVLEDDVELPSGFKSLVEAEIEKHRDRWDYLLFDYWRPGFPFIARWFQSAVTNFKETRRSPAQNVGFVAYTLIKACYIVPLSIMEGYRDRYKERHPGPVRFYRPLYLAGAYLVSAEGARKLLSLSSPIVYTADKLPNQARIKAGLRFYAYAPLSVRQQKEVFGSSILGPTAKNA